MYCHNVCIACNMNWYVCMHVCAHACMWCACVCVCVHACEKLNYHNLYTVHASPHRNLAGVPWTSPPSPLCQWYPLLPCVNGTRLCQWYPLLPYVNGTPFSPMPMVPPSPLCLWYPLLPHAYGTPFSPMPKYGVINGNKFWSWSGYNSTFFI